VKDAEILTSFKNVQHLASEIPREIKVADAYRRATDCHALAKQLYKEVDAKREASKAPHLEAGRTIDAAAKLFLTPLDDIINNMNRVRDDYKKRIAAEAAPPIMPDAVAIGVIPDLSQQSKTADTELPFVRTRSYMALEVFDVLLIPRHYLIVDNPKVLDALKAGVDVPGARLVKRETYL